ncbi:unnamed protein product, partial [Amoebophrya sp. A25]
WQELLAIREKFLTLRCAGQYLGFIADRLHRADAEVAEMTGREGNGITENQPRGRDAGKDINTGNETTTTSSTGAERKLQGKNSEKSMSETSDTTSNQEKVSSTTATAQAG